ncbi:MAG: rhs element Vgr protein [Pseudomonas sp.]|nr:rhs element Vgr protein [Pseudomonas sp.]
MFDPAHEPIFRLDIPNLSHTLNVLSFSGTEAISQPFAFELEVVSDCSDLDLQSLMYRSVWLSFAGSKGGINGQIHGAGHSRRGPNLGHYRLSLGPRLVCLAQRFNQRIFQCLSAPQIIARVLKEHGIRADAHRFELSGTYPERMYCAQYQESDLQFVQRLCEEEGIHYHFQHSERGHVLVFGDAQGGFRRGRTCRFQTETAGQRINRFTVKGDDGLSHSRRSQQRAEGESTSPSLRAGQLLPLTGHPRRDWNHLWLVTEIRHRGNQVHVFDELSIGVVGPRLPYSNTFRATPWEVGFRPALPLPRPPMFGVQRARVVGPIADRVYSDPLGRISVQFDWGHQGVGAHYASCWVPVSPVLADALPRVGMDVVVSFVDADPDQPRVIACLPSRNALPVAAAEEADEVSAPVEGALRMRLDPRTFVSAGQRIELSEGIVLTFENTSKLLFSVGSSSVRLGDDGLKLCSEQIVFEAAPEGVTPPIMGQQLLELLQASHPLVLLCRQPEGGSFAHCQRAPCPCRMDEQ